LNCSHARLLHHGATHRATHLARILRTRLYRAQHGGCRARAARTLQPLPATPTCTITWFIRGTAYRTSNGQPLPGPIVFGGPHTIPTASYNPQEVEAFMLIVMPDALRAMTGIDAGEHVNRLSPAHEVLDAI